MIAAAKPAPVKVEIEPEELMLVLYVEHDKDYRESLVESLKKWGCSVDAVARPFEAARILEPNKYQMVIVDIGFNPPDIQGDDFLVQNRDLLRGTRAIALTGQRYRIKRWEEFEAMGVQVVTKGDEISPLREATQQVFTDRKQRIQEQLEEIKSAVVRGHKPVTGREFSIATVAMQELQNELLNQLRGMGNKDERTILYKGKKYSVNDLISEVEQGTEVGRAHVRMMLNLHNPGGNSHR
jgi:DNA-binding response OmpR family regulator